MVFGPCLRGCKSSRTSVRNVRGVRYLQLNQSLGKCGPKLAGGVNYIRVRNCNKLRDGLWKGFCAFKFLIYTTPHVLYFLSRVAFQRHDYEGVSSAGGEAVMRSLETKLQEAQAGSVAEVVSAENFS